MIEKETIMVKRIDLFMPPRSQYGVLHHFTKKLGEALTAVGVKSRILEAEYHNPEPFLQALMSDRPDCTLSFNGLLPDEKGRFFCDMLNIPHVACIVDSQNLFIPLIHTPLTIIVCSDRFSCEFFRGLKSRNVLFMPHGVEKELKPDPSMDKIYDVSMLCSLIDYESKRKEWKEKYGPILAKIMDEAVELTLADSTTSYVQALVNAIDKYMELHHNLDPRKIDFISIMDDLEIYIKGKSRIDLIKSVKDAHVHIFGSTTESAGWEKYLGKSHKNYTIHESVPYEQAIDILKQSKIVLNACPWIKNGAHERIFYGLACGALPMTSENIFMLENFVNEKDILLYQTANMEAINEKVNEYLSNDTKREAVAAEGRKVTMAHHTWEQRASLLVKELAPILENIKTEAQKK